MSLFQTKSKTYVSADHRPRVSVASKPSTLLSLFSRSRLSRQNMAKKPLGRLSSTRSMGMSPSFSLTHDHRSLVAHTYLVYV